MSREMHYRRLLALYPRDHRGQHGEEMLGVLLATGGGWRDDLDVVVGAIALHLRRIFALDGGVRLRDVMAVVSLLGPLALLAGAATNLHEIAWWIFRAHSLSDMPYTQIPDAPVWAVWLMVAVLVLFGQRRGAAIAAWFAIGVNLVIMSTVHLNYSPTDHPGELLLGLGTAISLTWSAGPVRGREMVGRRGILFVLGGDAAYGLILAVAPSFYRVSAIWAVELAPWFALAAPVLGAYLACRRIPSRRTARRAVFMLALPTVANLVEYVAVAIVGPPMFWVPVVTDAVFYGIPMLLVLSGYGIFRPVRKSPAS